MPVACASREASANHKLRRSRFHCSAVLPPKRKVPTIFVLVNTPPCKLWPVTICCSGFTVIIDSSLLYAKLAIFKIYFQAQYNKFASRPETGRHSHSDSFTTKAFWRKFLKLGDSELLQDTVQHIESLMR